MKCSIIKVSIALFLLIVYLSSGLEAKTHHRAQHKSKSAAKIKVRQGHLQLHMQSHKFNEEEAKKVAHFAKLANCAAKPLPHTCKECLKPDHGFKMFFFYQFSRMKKYHYKILVHYNDHSKQVIISFGAPSVEEHKYLKRIYTRGWSLVKHYHIRVETEFRRVYFLHLKKILHEKVHKLKQSGRGGYKFIFTGYSLGGSVSVLAALDFTQSKILHSGHNALTVYTYGGLRIGDKNFVAMINSSFALWRIVKENDYIVRIPNCYYSRGDNTWRCLSEPVIRRYINSHSNKFPQKVYYRRYINAKGPLGRRDLEEKANQILHSRFSSFLEKARTRSTKSRTHSRSKSRGKAHSRNKSHSRSKSHSRNKSHSRSKSHLKLKQIQHAVKTYIRYIYYTQPAGREIFYNPAMTSYRTCHYVHGVSNCEKKGHLPASFDGNAHKTYFGINFEHCK